MTKEEFEVAIKEVYDNLTKEQFYWLINNSADTIKNLIKSNKAKHIKSNDGSSSDFVFEDSLHKFAYDVFKTVVESKRISFKQFKMLSAFSKSNWFNSQEEEFKQF